MVVLNPNHVSLPDLGENDLSEGEVDGSVGEPVRLVEVHLSCLRGKAKRERRGELEKKEVERTNRWRLTRVVVEKRPEDRVGETTAESGQEEGERESERSGFERS